MTKITDAKPASPLAALLRPESIVLNLKAQEKIAAIRELSRPLLDESVITDEQEFYAAILRRENLESTGIGQGIAIPHARTKAVKQTALAFGRSDKGVDFNSLDGKPCHLIFLIAAHEDKKTEYIMTLARVSKLLRKDEVRIGLNKAKTPEEVISVLALHE